MWTTPAALRRLAATAPTLLSAQTTLTAVRRLTARLALTALTLLSAQTTLVRRSPERGDVPGWVMVTLMTAGLVAGIWLLADDWLRQLFQQAVDRVSGP